MQAALPYLRSKPSELAARVEDACLNAWPALQEIHYDGWLIRLADGQTRRTNSVNLLQAGLRPANEKIAYCEDVYRRHGLPSCFRILSTQKRTVEDLLAERGYRQADETRTLYMDFARHPPVHAATPAVELVPQLPSEEWLSARMRFQNAPAGERSKVEKILQHLAIPAVFAAMHDESGAIVSIAKGAVHDGLVCLNMVASDPTKLRRGYSRACLSAILGWAREEMGATGACLQVMSGHMSAIRLYERLGFSRELYRYHYRTRRLA